MKKLYLIYLTLFSTLNGNIVRAEQPENVKTVDLGLTSGTLWANMNLGASSVTELGNYFAWGETTIRSSNWFDQASCPLYKITKTNYIDDDGFTVTETTKGYIKYVKEDDASKYGYDGFFDNKNELESIDDAAYVLWGENWKLPTEAQWRELVSECTWQSVTLNGTDGYKVIGKNNNYIFLPKGGYCFNTWIQNQIGEYACYWSSSLSNKSNEAYGFTETGNPGSGVVDYRYMGRLMRAVSISSCSFKLTYQVDGVEYKTYEIASGAAITPEPEPIKEGYTFSGWSEIPEIMPAHDVTVTGSFTKNILGTCATPTIVYEGGKLKFGCATDNVTFHYDIKDSDIHDGEGDEVDLGVTYEISVYATHEDYYDSEIATATLCWIDADPNSEGIANDVSQVRAQAVLINTKDRHIYVSGLDDGTRVCVYNVNGTLTESVISKDGKAVINSSLSIGSPVIVKIGNKSVKFAIK